MKSFFPGLILLAAFPSTVLAQAPDGAEFQVNTYTTNFQYGLAVASGGSGNFVVVWASDGQDGSNFGIFGQRFSASGLPQGSEFQVNTYATGKQYSPAVASDANGNFVVVWQGDGEDGSGNGIFGQRFSALGVPQGPEFRVNSYTTFTQNRPAVASDSGGNFVVVWQSDFQDASGVGVFGQRFNNAGVAQGSEFQVNSYTTGFQSTAAVASDPGGNFLVVWASSAPQDGSGSAVMGQRFNAAGIPQGSEFRVNSYTTGAQFAPKVSADANGNFVVVWLSVQDGSSSGVVGQRLDASGVLQGSEFQVNSYTTGRQAHAAVSSDADGNFAVVWDSAFPDGSSYGIFGQRFNALGVPQGGEFGINSHTTGSQISPAVDSDANGNFVVAWNSAGQDGSGYGVFGQRYGDLIFKDGFQ